MILPCIAIDGKAVRRSFDKGKKQGAIGIKRKRLKAALSPDYLSRILAGQGLS